MTPEQVTALVIALGGASLIPKLIDVFNASRNGKAIKEKEENQTLLTRTVNAETRAEREAEFRQRIQEWAGELVYMLKQIGVPEDKIPVRPERKERTTAQ